MHTKFDVCQWIAAGQWFSSGSPDSSTNKSDWHDITEILLKVVLNTKFDVYVIISLSVPLSIILFSSVG